MITLIAAIGKHNELGNNNRLLCHIPADLKHFKEYTTGKMVIMGRRTFESIGQMLPGRKCIVVSSRPSHVTIYAKSIEAALSIEHCYPELVIIGGANVYDQTIGLADKLIITHIDASFAADVFFPTIDMNVWKINTITDGIDSNYKYKIVEYIRKNEIRRVSTGKTC